MQSIVKESRHPDQTRARILEVVLAESHRHGFQAASIVNILAATGLAKGALITTFPTRSRAGWW
jgi:AcrR family transcriptional regulator